MECGVVDLLWDVASYEQATKGALRRRDHEGLILDEAHYLKTPESQRTRAIFGENGVARLPSLRVRWGLTGTPILNRPRELWPILKTLHPSFAGMSTAKFHQRFCGAFYDGRGINSKGASNLDELRGLLNGFMLRRTKAEVLTQLPSKIITRVPLDVSKADMEIIEAAENEILDREAKLSSAAEDFSQLGDLAHLLRVTGRAKVEKAAAFVEDLLEVEEKVVVFTRHRVVLAELAEKLKEYVPAVYQGGMSDGGKQSAIDAFRKNPDCRVFIGNIQASGTGINGLQEAGSCCVFAELSWVPGEMEQAIGRLDRIGQKAKSINVYLLHIPGSMESAVLGVQNAKGSVIGRLMGETGWRV